MSDDVYWAVGAALAAAWFAFAMWPRGPRPPWMGGGK